MAALDKAGAPAIKYGLFINDVISFVILGFVVFMFIKAYNKLKEPVVEAAPSTPAEEVLLTEIRDLLKK
jgi:large conductance mechanosensitive channel